MADIELVIKIPEKAYQLLKNEGVDWLGAEHILNAVANGIPLPKDQYEARLKADMVAVLENLDLEIDEHSYIYADGVSKKSDYVSCEDMHNLIRIMINNLRRDNESSM